MTKETMILVVVVIIILCIFILGMYIVKDGGKMTIKKGDAEIRIEK